MYYYGIYDWGEQHEYALKDQWESQEEYWYNEQAEEAYPAEEEYQDRSMIKIKMTNIILMRTIKTITNDMRMVITFHPWTSTWRS